MTGLLWIVTGLVLAVVVLVEKNRDMDRHIVDALALVEGDRGNSAVVDAEYHLAAFAEEIAGEAK